MTFFNSLNDGLQVIFIALCALGFICQLFLLCLCISRRKNIILTVCTALVAVLCALNVTRLSYGEPIFSSAGLLSSDIAVIIAISVNISLGVISLILSINEAKKSIVSEVKIPQYLEEANIGVLFADKSGRVLIANSKMKELCRRIMRSELKDANAFFDTVFSTNQNKRFTVFNIDGKPIFRFSANSAWEFVNTELDGGNYIITATEASQVLNTAEQITENKRLIKETRNRLQWTLDNLDGLKTQAEIAQNEAPVRSKISDYSSSLYQSIESDKDIKPEQIGINLIAQEDRLQLIINAFELIGVSVNVIGKMPSDSVLFPILSELLFSCASSAVALCRAEHITMAIYEGGNKLTANINCDGAALMDKHTDVFNNIQNRITSLGGTFTLTRAPILKLSVMLPK